MHKTLQLAFLVALLLVGASCKSSDSEPQSEIQTAQVHTTGDDCICGSEHADLYGCHCDDCLLNGGNPDNPDCTCLPLAPADEIRETYVGMGGPPGGHTVGALVGMNSIKLRKGGKVEGEVLDDDGTEIVFRPVGGAETVYTYEQLDHRMVYRLLKAKSSKNNAEDELKLATYARDCGLFAHSRRHYANVMALEPDREAEVAEGLAELSLKAADSQMQKARAAYDAGDTAKAREHLATIMNEFPDSTQAGSASAMLGELNLSAMGEAQRMAAGGLSSEVVGELAPIGESYEVAVKKNAEGLQNTKNSSKSRSSYRSAIGEATKARKQLSDLGSKNLSDAGLQSGVKKYDALFVDLLVDTHLNLASLYYTRASYNDALSETNAALAVAPENDRALEMRSRIESARDSYKEGYSSGYRQGQNSGVGVLGYRYRYGYYPGASISIGRVSGYGRWGGARMSPIGLR